MKRLIVIILLCLTALPVICFSEEIYETRLNSGLRSTEAYSYLLMEKAPEHGGESVQLLKEAVKTSPDLPPVYFALAKAHFSLSLSGIFESVEHVISGISAYARNFWYAFTLSGSLFFSIVLSFVVAMSVIVAARFPGDIQLFAHDLAEAKYLLFLLALLIVISGVSPLLFIAGLLVLLGLYMKKLDRIVVYLFLVQPGMGCPLKDFRSATLTSKGHGRLEVRTLTTSSQLKDFLGWPFLHQVFKLERTVMISKTGKRRSEIVYGVTSLSAEQASPLPPPDVTFLLAHREQSTLPS